MRNIQFNELINNNAILLFFLDAKKSNNLKLRQILILFLFVPVILLFLSYSHQTLFLKSEGHIGMLDDSLFLFIIFLVPLQYLILNQIIKKFLSFLEEIPSFTKVISDKRFFTIIEKYISFIHKKRPRLMIIKGLLFIFFMFSNTKSLYYRVSGWNSPEHLMEFVLTLLLVAFIIINLVEIVTKLLIIIIAQIKLTNELNQNNLLDIKPLSLDKSGSLSSLSELSLSFTYILIPFMFSAITHYLTWGNLTIGFTVSLVILAFSTVFLFFFPLGTVHSLMKKSKKEFLKEIDDTYLTACDKLLHDIKLDKKDIKINKDYCESIKQLYENGKEMPVWPFDLKILTKFMTIVLGPLVLFLIKFLIQKLSENMF